LPISAGVYLFILYSDEDGLEERKGDGRMSIEERTRSSMRIFSGKFSKRHEIPHALIIFLVLEP
jgi:hypothetical protein